MRLLTTCKASLVVLAVSGIVIPPSTVQATPRQRMSVPSVTTRTTPTGRAIRDAALGRQGPLRGTVVDAQGQALAGSRVVVRYEGHEIARAVTDRQGRFAVAGLQGGTYQVDAAGDSSAWRLWAAGTAPPAAREQMLLASGEAVRGQTPLGSMLKSKHLLVGAFVLAAILIPVAVHQSNSDRPGASVP